MSRRPEGSPACGRAPAGLSTPLALAGVLAIVGVLTIAPGLAVAAAPGTSAAPEDEKPLDARTYAQGLEAVRQGKREDAARILRKVFTDFPDSPYAPPAILKVAEMLYPVTSWEQVGSAPPAAIKEAGDLLTTLAQKYRSSREAPRALVRLGYLALEPANPKAELEEACSRFAASAQSYPDSDAADDAYLGSGICEALRARPARAADFFTRLLDEHPGSPLAPEALYRLGAALSHLGDPAEAMLALQEVRDRYPESRFAARALDRITLLHRLRLIPGLQVVPAGAVAAGPGASGSATAALAATGSRGPGASAGSASRVVEIYRFDAEYGAPVAQQGAAALSFRGATDAAIDAQGLAVNASPKSPGVFRLDAKGRIQEKIAHPGPEFVAVGDGLAVYISGKEQIAVNTRNWSGPELKGIDGRAPRDFGPIALDPLGRVYLLDRSENALLIFDRGRRLTGTLRPAGGKEGRFVDVAMGEDGAVFVLDGRAKQVVEMHQGRETARTSLAALGLDEPVALAADALGDLFVLDGKTGWVTVGDPVGKKITTIRPERDALARSGDPSAVAVDAVGRVYLAGRKGSSVVRFR